jgi:hypothetical protein
MAEDKIISFIPENDAAFKRGLQRLAESTNDFRIPFGLIGKHWYRGNKKIFGLKSEGLYHPLGGFKYREKVKYMGQYTTRQERAEVIKSEKYGLIFPLLKATGTLAASLTSKTSQGAVFFAGRQDLVMGTEISYAKFHQSDRPRKKLPQRKPIFISGGPAERARDSVVSGRREAWLNIINDHINQIVTGKI